MSTVVKTRAVGTLINDHRKLLRRFNRVSHYVSGVCAGLYLPGVHQTFDRSVRKIVGKRPVLVTLEAAPTGLSFVGAISRLRAGKLHWQGIFNYDLSIPMTPRGGGRVLSAKNLVIARRGLELLSAMTDFAYSVADNTAQDLEPIRFPTILRRAGKIVGEDYAPVLGFEVPNPAKDLEMVSARRYNVADKVLARRGLEKLEDIGEEMWPVVMAEFRAEYPEFSISAEIVLDALKSKPNFVSIPIPADEAMSVDPDAVVQATRDKLPGRFRFEASHKDLLLAAANPNKPLRVSRLSALQLFPVETAQDLPDGYTGSVLSTVKMLPPPGAVSPVNEKPAIGG